MSTRSDSDNDDDFRDLYKEYTGPTGTNAVNAGTNAVNATDKPPAKKRSHDDSDEDGGSRDPNAVPTDFTSREAKVWEAKSKATERNWKKKKEEEMICKLCGDSGHFTQGCPSTLGANRKSQDFFQRVPARDSHIRAIFTEKVVQKIERDVGCKIKMDEKFFIVSGKDRLILAKGVDAVHGMINQQSDLKGSSCSRKSRSRSPERSPLSERSRHHSSQRSRSGPSNASQFQQRFSKPEKVVEDHVRNGFPKTVKGSPQAYGNDRSRGPSNHAKSPANPPYRGNSHNNYDGHNQNMSGYNRADGWESEKRALDMRFIRQFEAPSGPHTYEELELEYKREAMELGKIRDKEEDEENYKHREAIREMRENYMKKVAIARNAHAKQWEEFIQHDAQRLQQQAYMQMPGQGFGTYKQQLYADFDGSSNPYLPERGFSVGSRNGYQDPVDTNPSRLPGGYGDFQQQIRDNYGKTYARY